MVEHTNGERAHAFQQLRESEELHRATLSNISDAVFLTDDDGTFTFICPNVDVIFGYTPDEVREFSRIDALLGANLFDRGELVAREEIRNIEREVIRKSGEHRSVLIHVKAVSILGGTQLYTCRDVTEHKHTSDELQAARLNLAHLSRLALVGELTASIAHEVNQPLTSIVSNATAGELLLGRADVAQHMEELREILHDIDELGHQAAAVIGRIQGLSRKRPLERQPLQMADLVSDTLRLIGGDARRRRVTLEADVGTVLPVIAADRVSMQQVLLNLALNAMDAMEDVAPSERKLKVCVRQLDAGIELTITDTGHGIPSDRLPKIFDAFFTTKKEGMGLGLAISRSIVEAHGGRIAAEDHGGQGATFRVMLPAGVA